MDVDDPTRRLPVTYQRVLAWLDAGMGRDEIAARLAIDPQAVDPLVTLAKAKLARLTRAGEEQPC